MSPSKQQKKGKTISTASNPYAPGTESEKIFYELYMFLISISKLSRPPRHVDRYGFDTIRTNGNVNDRIKNLKYKIEDELDGAISLYKKITGKGRPKGPVKSRLDRWRPPKDYDYADGVPKIEELESD
ncbi:hypothetical protein GCK32_006070 [Trichostrongylus colubriformis]|uniref:Uncharacterized protein n=1 Tax=Trichostrongylus colubriformis TaxID=6319 RepID=A0AAN8IMS3_TRICO